MSANEAGDATGSRRARKSAFSCEPCRKRKVKCDGISPACTRCRTRGVECVYGLPPTLEYTKRLERRVAELEDQLVPSNHVSIQQDPIQGQQSSYGEYHTPPFVHNRAHTTSHHPSLGTSPVSIARSDVATSPHLDDLKVEENGRISFHGPTSFFQLPRNREDERQIPVPAKEDSNGRERLINDAWKARAFEQLANVPEPMKTLLNSHWTWIQPMFNFVYRPAFTRDMGSNGPYFSEALLNAILSHSIRWCKSDPQIQHLLEPYDGGRHFFRWAVTSVFENVQHGPGSVPDVQALLLLSAQEAGRGNRTQSWLYSGMAFRLLDDMGINIDGRKLATSARFTSEDIEIRNRLFWSCYSWEKMLCLYFGRSPTIQHTQASPPQMLMDDSGEVEIWSPLGLGVTDYGGYPPHQAHSTTAFMSMCSLSEILNRVLIQLYDPIRKYNEEEIALYIKDEACRLRSWLSALPPYLYLDSSNLPDYCPPSHIATLNCLFHSITILLHRPMLYIRAPDHQHAATAEHTAECTSSANAIVKIYEIYRRTFGDSHVVLIVGYSIYTAISVFLLEAQASKGSLSASTLSQLHFCVQALERIKVSSPVINAALRLIYEEMDKLKLNYNIDPSIMAQEQNHDPEMLGSTMNNSNSNNLPSYGQAMGRPTPTQNDWSGTGDIFVPDASLLPAQWGDSLDMNQPFFDGTGFAV